LKAIETPKGDLEKVLSAQWSPSPDGSIYLNAGSCGRKPKCVLEAIEEGWRTFDSNPTKFVFLDTDPLESARIEASILLSLPPDSIMFTQNVTQALQIILQTFLLDAGDELVTTDQVHNCLYAIGRYLEETRGVVVRRLKVDPFRGSNALVEDILKLVGDKTRLVVISEIFSTSGWRADLEGLVAPLANTSTQLCVDGAHAPGQGPVSPGRFPLWVGAGHKWLGGPNGTGFLFAQPHLAAKLKPVNIADRYYDQYPSNLKRLEWIGTSDGNLRWLGLKAACRLQIELGQEKLWQRQQSLMKYLVESLQILPEYELRTPLVEGEQSGMLTITWQPDRVPVPDLSAHLWDRYRICVRPDLFFGKPGNGMRISCHPSNTTTEIDHLIKALKEIFKSKK
jgi:selenocysteine lyase/cysteine desulfurase